MKSLGWLLETDLVPLCPDCPNHVSEEIDFSAVCYHPRQQLSKILVPGTL